MATQNSKWSKTQWVKEEQRSVHQSFSYTLHKATFFTSPLYIVNLHVSLRDSHTLSLPNLQSPCYSSSPPTWPPHYTLFKLSPVCSIPLPAAPVMARSLLAPLAGTAPSLHSSLFSNFPLHSHSFPSRTLSSAVHKPSNCYTHYSLTSLHRRLSPVSALDSDVPHPLHQVILFWWLNCISPLIFGFLSFHLNWVSVGILRDQRM